MFLLRQEQKAAADSTACNLSSKQHRPAAGSTGNTCAQSFAQSEAYTKRAPLRAPLHATHSPRVFLPAACYAAAQVLLRGGELGALHLRVLLPFQGLPPGKPQLWSTDSPGRLAASAGVWHRRAKGLRRRAPALRCSRSACRVCPPCPSSTCLYWFPPPSVSVQSDSEFVELLARIRAGTCPQDKLSSLMATCQRSLPTHDGILPTRLYTHRCGTLGRGAGWRAPAAAARKQRRSGGWQRRAGGARAPTRVPS